MNEYSIQPGDVYAIIMRHRKTMAMTFVVTFLAVMGLFVVIPKTYRTEAVMHIGVNYFQNPLIGDLISQTHDPGELRAEREKIIKSALGLEFAKSMGEKYQLFKSKPDEPGYALELELFLKSLDIAPVTTTQFSLKYKGRRPDVVYGVIQSAIDAVRENMYASRVRMLEEFFSVLKDEMGTGGGSAPLAGHDGHTGAAGGAQEGEPQDSDGRLASERAQIGAQIQVLERRLADLQRAYSESHPSIQAIKYELAELRDAERSGNLSARLARKRWLVSGISKGESSTFKEVLRKQEHLLNISLEMEKKDPTMSSYVTLVKEPIYPKSPVFPKLKLFMLSALIIGVLMSTLVVAGKEFWERTLVSPRQLSESLGAELV